MQTGVDTGRLPGVVGQVLGGRYELMDEIGKGGMAVVWRAYDSVLGRTVAVKLLAGPHAGDPDARQRVRDEARAAAALSHPNIAQVYDYGESDDSGTWMPYIVMELIRGQTLQERQAGGPLSPAYAMRVAAEVAAALAAAHADGLAHRDIKPANIMLTTQGAKVVDFGIAAAIRDGQAEDADFEVLGTPAYLAPERLTDDAVAPASDVYALGVLLYRLLANDSPWSADTTTEMLAAHIYLEPAPLPPLAGVPAYVTTLCNRCLSKDPTLRPSARDAAGLLAHAAGLRIVEDEPAPSGPAIDHEPSVLIRAAKATPASAMTGTPSAEPDAADRPAVPPRAAHRPASSASSGAVPPAGADADPPWAGPTPAPSGPIAARPPASPSPSWSGAADSSPRSAGPASPDAAHSNPRWAGPAGLGAVHPPDDTSWPGDESASAAPSGGSAPASGDAGPPSEARPAAGTAFPAEAASPGPLAAGARSSISPSTATDPAGDSGDDSAGIPDRDPAAAGPRPATPAVAFGGLRPASARTNPAGAAHARAPQSDPDGPTGSPVGAGALAAAPGFPPHTPEQRQAAARRRNRRLALAGGTAALVAAALLWLIVPTQREPDGSPPPVAAASTPPASARNVPSTPTVPPTRKATEGGGGGPAVAPTSKTARPGKPVGTTPGRVDPTSVSPTPAPTQTTTATVPQERTLSSSGGSVVAVCRSAETVELVSWSATKPYKVDAVDPGPDATAVVTFKHGNRRVIMTVTCSDGRPSTNNSGD